MGNWDNLYYDIYEEVTQLGVKKQFDALVEKLASSETHRNQSVRSHWALALEKIKNHEQ